MRTVWRRCSPMTASASAIQASARRMALPTATRARSGWSGKDLVRPANPAALDSWATSQSRSARAWLARPGSCSISVSRRLSRLRYSAIASWSRTCWAVPASPAVPLSPARPAKIGGLDLLARVGDQHRQVDHPDAVLHQDAAVPQDQPPVPADPVALCHHGRDRRRRASHRMAGDRQAHRGRLGHGRSGPAARRLSRSRSTLTSLMPGRSARNCCRSSTAAPRR